MTKSPYDIDALPIPLPFSDREKEELDKRWASHAEKLLQSADPTDKNPVKRRVSQNPALVSLIEETRDGIYVILNMKRKILKPLPRTLEEEKQQERHLTVVNNFSVAHTAYTYEKLKNMNCELPMDFYTDVIGASLRTYHNAVVDVALEEGKGYPRLPKQKERIPNVLQRTGHIYYPPPVEDYRTAIEHAKHTKPKER